MELGRVEIDERDEWNLAAIFALLVGVRCSTDDDYEQFDTHFRNGFGCFRNISPIIHIYTRYTRYMYAQTFTVQIVRIRLAFHSSDTPFVVN